MAGDVASGLAKAAADAGTRTAEEAAALAAVVTVPMRVRGSEGWAGAKTAVFGGRVIGSRTRQSIEKLAVMCRPRSPAIPTAPDGASGKSARLTPQSDIALQTKHNSCTRV